jgi:flagellar motor switch protein FliN
MTDTQKTAPETTENPLLSAWARAMEEVLGRLTGTRPRLRWSTHKRDPEEPEIGASVEWWQAEYRAEQDFHLWIGIPAPTAPGLSRLAQALSEADQPAPAAGPIGLEETIVQFCVAFQESLSHGARRPVSHLGPRRLEAAPAAAHLYSSTISLSSESSFPILVGFEDEAIAAFSRARSSQSSQSDPLRAAVGEGPLSLLLGMEMPLTIRFGRVQMPLERVLELHAGSVLELDQALDEPVDVLVQGRIVARGEVVAVDGNYGVRIVDLPDPASLKKFPELMEEGAWE